MRIEEKQDHRDNPSTITLKGERVWMYPKMPKGRYHNYRRMVAAFLLLTFFAGPFIKIGGQPLLLFNIFERKFILFGQIFWPQDTHLLIFALLILVVFVILFTVVYGRAWCGWTCPQTVFMELVFRKIEYAIEGDYNQQKKLNQGPWTTTKIWKKTLKHSLFLVMALWVAHTFMAYLIGIDRTVEIVTQPPSENLSGFIGILFFTALFYSIFALLRELACTVVCPYGRLQGAMLDKKSIVVIYDWIRGEPRGRIKKDEDQSAKGDCIDCNLCVQVCPTGIDIRDGTQLECVNCTACIDACDEVMDKIGKPRGLIRFDSQESIEENKRSVFNPRMVAYSLVLLLLLGAMGFLLKARSDVEMKVNRVAGSMYQVQDDGMVRNMFELELLNKTNNDMPLEIVLTGIEGILLFPSGLPDTLKAQDKDKMYLMIQIHRTDLLNHGEKITLELKNKEKTVDQVKIRFPGPKF